MKTIRTEVMPAFIRKLEAVSLKIGTNFPHFTNGNQYLYRNDGFWTMGFWPGLLFYGYQASGQSRLLELAVSCKKPLINMLEDSSKLDHDIGFLYMPLFVGHFKETNDEESRNTALQAAEILAGRFHEKGKFIVAWNDWEEDSPAFRNEKKGKFIIDSLMNLPLLYWAAEITGESYFAEIASAHAETVLSRIVRDDFSTYHTFNCHPETGLPIKGVTQQGFEDESCWSRGQAWALYGFSLVYMYTREEKFHFAAKGLADYFIRRLPEDVIPPWDFDADNQEIKDTSAAAIAASGMLLLDKLAENPKGFYYQNAIRILEHLNERYLDLGESFEGFLTHGCSDYPRGAGIHSGIIYGDYFYLECLLKLKGIPSVFEKEEV